MTGKGISRATGRSVSAEDRDQSGLFAGRFRLEEELGIGDLGRVFRAFDVVRRDHVALKILHQEVTDSAGGLAGMVPLLRSVGRLGHPALRHLHDFNEWRGQVYLSLELLSGQTLASRLVAGERWTPSEAAALLRPLVDALDHGRPQGPHRGIRPDHLWLVEPGGAASAPSVKLSDYGLASLLTPEQRVTEAALRGHAAFLAPEILTGGADGGEQADMFALGQIWLTMVRGEPLLPGTAADVFEDLPRSPETRLLRQLLAPHPAGRPASWKEVRDALTPRQRDRRLRLPDLPLPPSCRRLAGSAAGLLLVVGLIGWLAVRARPNSVAVTPEALRAAWNDWDATRLRLLARAASEPELLPTVEREFAPSRDWALARDWWRSESARSDEARRRILQTLSALDREAAGADRALAARGRLRTLSELARDPAGPALGLTNLPLAKSDTEWSKATDAFRDGRFTAAAEGYESGLAALHAALEAHWMQNHSRALAAQAAWHRCLSGMPAA